MPRSSFSGNSCSFCDDRRPGRVRLRSANRLIFVWLYRLFPSLLESAVIFKPETLVRWHRGGFRLNWRWKSRRRVGRPVVPTGTRNLIGQMSRENPLWGAPRIHGELLKLGVEISQSSGEAHLRRILTAYPLYYNRIRTHLALGKDAPLGRTVQPSGRIVPVPILGGLHHQYVRIT